MAVCKAIAGGAAIGVVLAAVITAALVMFAPDRLVDF